jgi:hypothetical protein
VMAAQIALTSQGPTDEDGPLEKGLIHGITSSASKAAEIQARPRPWAAIHPFTIWCTPLF